MRKIILLFLLLPFLISARYQVSCDMTFIDQNQAQEVYDYIKIYRGYGYNTNIPSDSDYLLPTDPNAVNLGVKFKYRLIDQSCRDTIYDYLGEQIIYTDQNMYGFIEIHRCFGDDPQEPCREQTINNWGVVE